jgi:hypothetical protein
LKAAWCKAERQRKKPEDQVELQITNELVLTGIYVGAMAIGIAWVLLRAIRYARRVRAQNAAEVLWMQTFAVQAPPEAIAEQSTTADNPEQNCAASPEDETPEPQPDGPPRAQ